MAVKMRYGTVSFKERLETADIGKPNLPDNFLAVVNPELAAQWHPTKNGNLTPKMMKARSGKRVWWQCKQGHEWQSTIANRSKGNGCPYCAGKKVLKGFNDLATVNPKLAAEWHPTKNGDLTPEMVTARSDKKVWWQCKQGHKWQSTIANRSKGNGCPYCAGKKVLKGFNDLATVNPKLATEWHPTKNGDLTPEMVSAGSGKKVWWRCKLGHEWQAVIASRNDGNGCLKCAAELQTSFAEQAIYYYIKKQYKDAINRDLSIGQELDVYIPSIKTAIEYDGARFHRSKQRDLSKNKLCKKHGIRLIRIRENGCPELDMDDAIIQENKSDGALNVAISVLAKKLNFDHILINVENDRTAIFSQYIACKKQNSLAATNPILSSEWHPTKNGELTPEMVMAGSGKKVWWQCRQGHEWQAVIVNRFKGAGCPYCAGQRAIAGVNDLATLNPELASEWHPAKNKNLKPNMFMPCSGKKVWWLGKCGHEWAAKMVDRSKGTDCPYCSRRKVLKGFNDLATLNPNLASEWHPTKNGGLTPDMVTTGSHKKVWWQCEQGHEWLAKIEHRSSGVGCPYCSGRYAIRGLSDLATVNSELAAEWHPTKNGNLTPDMVMKGSEKKVWWQCKQGHEWQATIASRSNGAGCPYCSRRNVIKGVNDLATVNPELAAEWHPTKNGELTPDMVTAGSSKKVWWRCKRGHEWLATIASRSNGAGCPYCSRRNVIKGVNDLATVNPELAAEWHPTKNGELTPDMVTAGSSKKVWWQCEQGHEWLAKINHRSSGVGCPYCSGRHAIKGVSDLATVNPKLATEWHPTKNENLTPDMVKAGSGKKVWWQCKQGHEWQATIYSRSNGYSCPICRKSKNKQ